MELKVGDVIGVRGAGFFAFLVSIGEFFAKPEYEAEYKFSHVGIIYFDGPGAYVLEALSEGVKSKPLYKYKGKYVIKRHKNIDADNIAELKMTIDLYKGKKISYNWLQLIWLGVTKIARLEFLSNPFRSKKSMICSELVARIYKEAIGFSFKPFEIGNIDPKDIMLCSHFEKILEVN